MRELDLFMSREDLDVGNLDIFNNDGIKEDIVEAILGGMTLVEL